MAAAAAQAGFVPFAVPGQANIFAHSPQTKAIESNIRTLTREVFIDYYKPSAPVQAYCNRYCHQPRYVYHAPSFFVINNNHYNAPSYGAGRRGSNDDGTKVLLIIVGTIIAVVGSYLLAKEVKKHTLAKEGLGHVKDLKHEVKEHYTDENTKALLRTGKSFFKKMEHDSYIWIGIKAAVVAGGILLAAGAIMAAEAIAIAGGVLIVGGLAAAAFRYGLTRGDDVKMSAMAQRILNIPA